MANRQGFKNTKLGKNVHRQVKRRGPQQPVFVKREKHATTKSTKDTK